MTIQFPVTCYHSSGTSYSFTRKDLENITKFNPKWTVEQLVEIIKFSKAYTEGSPIYWEPNRIGIKVLRGKTGIDCKNIFMQELSPRLNHASSMTEDEIENLKQLKSSGLGWTELGSKLIRPISFLKKAFGLNPTEKGPNHSELGAGAGSGSGAGLSESSTGEDEIEVRGSKGSDSDSDEDMPQARESSVGAGAGAGSGSGSEVDTTSDSDSEDEVSSEEDSDSDYEGFAKSSKSSYRKWDDDEVEILKELVEIHGVGNWRIIAKELSEKGYKRNSTQCREKYNFNLKKNVNNDDLTDAEKQAVANLHAIFGNKWTEIAEKITEMQFILNPKGPKGSVRTAKKIANNWRYIPTHYKADPIEVAKLRKQFSKQEKVREVFSKNVDQPLRKVKAVPTAQEIPFEKQIELVRLFNMLGKNWVSIGYKMKMPQESVQTFFNEYQKNKKRWHEQEKQFKEKQQVVLKEKQNEQIVFEAIKEALKASNERIVFDAIHKALQIPAPRVQIKPIVLPIVPQTLKKMDYVISKLDMLSPVEPLGDGFDWPEMGISTPEKLSPEPSLGVSPLPQSDSDTEMTPVRDSGAGSGSGSGSGSDSRAGVVARPSRKRKVDDEISFDTEEPSAKKAKAVQAPAAKVPTVVLNASAQDLVKKIKLVHLLKLHGQDWDKIGNEMELSPATVKSFYEGEYQKDKTYFDSLVSRVMG